jgi:ABC-type transporter Mla subunit MlaD
MMDGIDPQFLIQALQHEVSRLQDDRVQLLAQIASHQDQLSRQLQSIAEMAADISRLKAKTGEEELDGDEADEPAAAG